MGEERCCIHTAPYVLLPKRVEIHREVSMLEKTGEVRAGTTVCDKCSNAAVRVMEGGALCAEHVTAENEKRAATESEKLRSFTTPLSDDSDDT
jgi:hypothetical protein